MLSGCFGETYKFYPPSILYGNGIIYEDLVVANSAWKGEGNKPLVKETEDWFMLGKDEPITSFKAGEDIDFSLEHGDYQLFDTCVTLWTLEKEKIDLYVEEDDSVKLPTTKGEYILEFNLDTDAGKSQYVGHILLK